MRHRMAKFTTGRSISLVVGLGILFAGVLLWVSLGRVGWAFGGGRGDSMAVSPAGADHLQVQVQVELPFELTVRERTDIVVAVTQDRLATDVPRGENRGRTLKHSAVVRSLTALGSLTPSSRTFGTTATVPVSPEWNISDVRVIGFLQERQSRRVIGAGSANVDTHSGTR